jgi:hypothetical protein
MMPETRKRTIDIEVEMHLDVTQKERFEVHVDGANPNAAPCAELLALIGASQKDPLRSKGTLVIRFGSVENDNEDS